MYNLIHVQPEDGHYQEPKHVFVPYVENTLYSTNKCSCVRRVHTLYIIQTEGALLVAAVWEVLCT